MRDWNKLYTKYLRRECSEDEIRQLLDHFSIEGNESALLPRIEAELARTDIPVEEDPEVQATLDRILVGLRKSIANDRRSRRTAIIRRIKSWSAAAAILLAASAIFYYTYTRPAKERIANRNTVQQSVPPGGNRAILTLADGRQVELSSRQKGIIVGDDITYEDGTSVTGGNLINKDSEIQYAILTTPRAGQYNIILPDGSRVWLNAETTLKYPLKFTGDQRLVELEGEAYFEVNKSSTAGKKNIKHLPFLVKTGRQTVKVLGTHFNISAYPSESVATTLTEGSVQVLPDTYVPTATPLLLRPGQQSILHGDKVQVIPVDTTQYIAWKDGLFNFNETELRVVMNQLKRWYDITIEYRGNIPATYYYGSISRNKSLEDVLALLKESGLKFSIEKGATTKLIISI